MVKARLHKVQVSGFQRRRQRRVVVKLSQLVHCYQSEGFPSRHRWLLAYEDEANRNGYEGNRFEQEAHEVARLLAHLRLVT